MQHLHHLPKALRFVKRLQAIEQPPLEPFAMIFDTTTENVFCL